MRNLKRRKADKVLGIAEICEEYGLDRKRVVRYLQMPECHTLPRLKGEPYLITRESWERFING